MSLTFYRAFFFFFNDSATTEIYTLSLHDALPIYKRHTNHNLLARRSLVERGSSVQQHIAHALFQKRQPLELLRPKDRKSTRLNSSHANISYAVFCLKKKKQQ